MIRPYALLCYCYPVFCYSSINVIVPCELSSINYSELVVLKVHSNPTMSIRVIIQFKDFVFLDLVTRQGLAR